jgi:hypothetical protein
MNGTVRLSSKGESDRITQRSAFRIRLPYPRSPLLNGSAVRLCIELPQCETALLQRPRQSWAQDTAYADLNSVCYNSFTEHGQMLGVADACGRFWAVWLTVHFIPKTGSIRWNGWKQAKRWTVRMDSKHAGLALTA